MASSISWSSTVHSNINRLIRLNNLTDFNTLFLTKLGSTNASKHSIHRPGLTSIILKSPSLLESFSLLNYSLVSKVFLFKLGTESLSHTLDLSITSLFSCLFNQVVSRWDDLFRGRGSFVAI